MTCDPVNEIGEIATGCRKNDGSEEIDENNESHGKAAETTEVLQENQLSQIVDWSN